MPSEKWIGLGSGPSFAIFIAYKSLNMLLNFPRFQLLKKGVHIYLTRSSKTMYTEGVHTVPGTEWKLSNCSISALPKSRGSFAPICLKQIMLTDGNKNLTDTAPSFINAICFFTLPTTVLFRNQLKFYLFWFHFCPPRSSSVLYSNRYSLYCLLGALKLTHYSDALQVIQVISQVMVSFSNSLFA